MADVEFPKTVIEFANELIELCRKHDLRSFRGKLTPGFSVRHMEGWNEFSFSWSAGRHGEDGRNMNVSAHKHEVLKLPVLKPCGDCGGLDGQHYGNCSPLSDKRSSENDT